MSTPSEITVIFALPGRLVGCFVTDVPDLKRLASA
jgi:hypothetical protein